MAVTLLSRQVIKARLYYLATRTQMAGIISGSSTLCIMFYKSGQVWKMLDQVVGKKYKRSSDISISIKQASVGWEWRGGGGFVYKAQLSGKPQ